MEQHPEIPIIDIEQYGGKQVAILDGDVVAVGETLAELVQLAKQHPSHRPLEDYSSWFHARDTFSVCGSSHSNLFQQYRWLRIAEVLDSIGMR